MKKLLTLLAFVCATVNVSSLLPGVYFLAFENIHAKTINKLVKIE